MNRAVIYVPRDVEFVATAAACLDHATQAGYELEGIVVGHFAEAWAMVLDGRAQVVVVADFGHLPSDRVPRVEVASNGLMVLRPAGGGAIEVEPPAPTQRRRRPRRTQ